MSEIFIEYGTLCFTIRKPVLDIAKTGKSQEWLPTIYDIQKKYASELAELYPLVNSLELDEILADTRRRNK